MFLLFMMAASASQETDLELWGFNLQLDSLVVSSTKTEQRAELTPAVVTVVKSDEIAARGYRSLADILRAVPGFYDTYDLVTHNFGVRGVNGGVRASGSVMKVMIDGHPVDFRPSTGNFFGEELIPIHAIDRVEIIRGPASALYGANAYLGVVNIITKKVSGVRVSALGVSNRDRFGAGVEAIGGGSTDAFELMAGFSYLYMDRSGLSSTVNDVARPWSAVAKARLDKVIFGELEALVSIQRLDSVGNFLDFGGTDSSTRVALLNQNYKLRYKADVSDTAAVTVGAFYLNGAPTQENRWGIGRSDYVLLRRVGAEGFGFDADARLRFFDRWSLVGGADYAWTRNELQRFDQLLISDVFGADGGLLRAAGSVLPAASSARVFQNVGVYAQSVVEVSDFSLTAGLRLDIHNIYGSNLSGRGAAVWAPKATGVSLKLLYGSSFKAPTAEQLYAQPFGVNDVQGNDRLKAQSAHNVELALSYRLPKDLGELSLNLFTTLLKARVEFLQRGLFLIAQNLGDQWLVGGEAEGRVNPVRSLHLRLSGSVVRTVAQSDDVFLSSLPRVTNPSMPVVQIHFIADYALPVVGLKASAEVSLIGPRGSSQSNALVAGQAYALPAYVYTALVLSMPAQQWLGARDTSFSIRVENLPNLRWNEVGFFGVNPPNLGIGATLWLTQQL